MWSNLNLSPFIYYHSWPPPPPAITTWVEQLSQKIFTVVSSSIVKSFQDESRSNIFIVAPVLWQMLQFYSGGTHISLSLLFTWRQVSFPCCIRKHLFCMLYPCGNGSFSPSDKRTLPYKYLSLSHNFVTSPALFFSSSLGQTCRNLPRSFTLSLSLFLLRSLSPFHPNTLKQPNETIYLLQHSVQLKEQFFFDCCCGEAKWTQTSALPWFVRSNC